MNYEFNLKLGGCYRWYRQRVIVVGHVVSESTGTIWVSVIVNEPNSPHHETFRRVRFEEITSC